VTLSFGECETARRFVNQHLLDEVEEVLPGLGVRRVLGHVATKGLAVFADVTSGRRLLVPDEPSFLEVLDSGFGGHARGESAEDALHHGEVFAVVVGLEEGEPEGQLKQDAADGPDVAGLSPAEFENDFRRSVVSGGDDGAVVFVVEGGAAEIDQPDFGVAHETKVLLLLVVVDLVERAVEEEDVLRLEVRVRQPVVVQELDGEAQLVSHLPHLLDRVGHVVVVLEEVKDGGAEHLEDDAHVAVEVEPVEHLNATMLATRIVLGQLLQNVDLQLGGLAILLDVLDDLERQDLFLPVVFHFDHLPEGPLSQGGHDLVAILDDVPDGVDEMSLVVVLDGRLSGLPLRRRRLPSCRLRRLLPSSLLPVAALAAVEVPRMFAAAVGFGAAGVKPLSRASNAPRRLNTTLYFRRIILNTAVATLLLLLFMAWRVNSSAFVVFVEPGTTLDRGRVVVLLLLHGQAGGGDRNRRCSHPPPGARHLQTKIA